MPKTVLEENSWLGPLLWILNTLTSSSIFHTFKFYDFLHQDEPVVTLLVITILSACDVEPKNGWSHEVFFFGLVSLIKVVPLLYIKA